MPGARTRAPKRSGRRASPAHDRQERRSIWREALWGLDWLSLRLSPVYLGIGVPRGDGSPVVLVPGYLTIDAYLLEMYLWLRRIGYSPHLSGLVVNADCIEAVTQWLENTVADTYEQSGRPVRLIGHSLGGVLARRVAVNRPEIVSQLISLGSPIQALNAHPAIMAAATVLGEAVERLHHAAADVRGGSDRCLGERCECSGGSGDVLSPPPSVRRAAIYTRDDGVINWRNCLEPDPSLNHEVGGTHIGLVFNPQVYRIVADVLAQASATPCSRAA